MKYIKSHKSFKVNEGWLDSKLKTLSDGLKNLFTIYCKPYEQISKDIQNKWKDGVKIEDIRYNILSAYDKSFKSIDTEIKKLSNPQEIEGDLLDNIQTVNIQIKDTLLKILNDKLVEYPKLDEYKNIITKIFDTLTKTVDSLKKDYLSEIQNIDSLDKKKSKSIEKIKNIFSVFENEVNNLDLEEISKSENVLEVKVGDSVSYKKEGYDDTKDNSVQSDYVSSGKVKSIEGDVVVIYNNDIKKDITKNMSDILNPTDFDVKGDSNELKVSLGKLKEDPLKISKVLDYVKKLEKE